MQAGSLRFTLLGAGAMNSPRYAPAGLLVEYKDHRVMIDGGPGAEPAAKLTDSSKRQFFANFIEGKACQRSEVCRPPLLT